MEYRFGFNGQEKDNEVSGLGNSNTAEFWQYDSRLGRRWNVDPVDQIQLSNYSCFANNPIYFVDPDGDVVIGAIAGFIKGLSRNDARRNSTDGLKGKNRWQEAWREGGRGLKNSAEIWGGLFAVDRRRNVPGAAWQLISRFSWEGLQTVTGFIAAHATNIFGNVRNVGYIDGLTYLELGGNRGGTAGIYGNYMYGSDMGRSHRGSNSTYWNTAKGHYKAQQMFGPLMIFLDAADLVQRGIIGSWLNRTGLTNFYDILGANSTAFYRGEIKSYRWPLPFQRGRIDNRDAAVRRKKRAHRGGYRQGLSDYKTVFPH